MSYGDGDQVWINHRLSEYARCHTIEHLQAAIARGYERGKAEGTADRDRLAKRLESADAMIEMYRAKCEVFRERLHAAQPEPSDRLAALEQRVGGIVETLWAEPDTETAEYRRRLAALRAPGMGSDVDVQRDRADRLAVLVDGLRGTLERTRAEIETLRAKLAGAEHAIADLTTTFGTVESERNTLRARVAELEARPDPARGLIERAAKVLETYVPLSEDELIADLRAYLGGG